MKLYISFNLTDLTKALNIANSVENFCDAFEIGPVLLASHGAGAIVEFRKQFPSKVIIADTNIAEFEKEIAEIAIAAGADIITVLAGAGINTIHNTCLTAENKDKKVMVDLIDAFSVGQITLDAKSLGAQALVVHTSEENSYLLLDRWDMVKGNTNLPLFISAHITRENIQELIKLEPSGLIIGSSITRSEDAQKEASFFYQLIKKQRQT